MMEERRQEQETSRKEKEETDRRREEADGRYRKMYNEEQENMIERGHNDKVSWLPWRCFSQSVVEIILLGTWDLAWLKFLRSCKNKNCV